MEKEVIVAIITGVTTIVVTVLTIIWKRRSGEPDSDAVSSSREALRKKSHRFDIFVSAPLAAFKNDKEIKADHDRIAPVVALLEGQLAMSVYWAGRNIRGTADFEAADVSAKNDVAAILESKYFLLLYPQKIASSVLFEAGIALRSCLTSIYFVRDPNDLPFLMTQASQAFTNVRTYKGAVPKDLIALLQKHGRAFFDPLRSD